MGLHLLVVTLTDEYDDHSGPRHRGHPVHVLNSAVCAADHMKHLASRFITCAGDGMNNGEETVLDFRR